MILQNQKKSVSVIITTHDAYIPFLQTAIDSLRSQTIKPDEIIVVFDSTPPIKLDNDIKYVQVQHRNPFLSRKSGFQLATSDIVIFLDGDDCLSNDYIAQGLAIKTPNNIVYSDIQHFGTSDKHIKYLDNIPPSKISQTNFLHVGCLVDAATITECKAFDKTPPTTCHEDWVFWRRIVRSGYCCSKQHGIYYARQHHNNRSAAITASYYEMKGISVDSITFIKTDGSTHIRTVIDQWPAEQRQLVCNRYEETDCERMIIHGGDFHDILPALTTDYFCCYDSNSAASIDLQELLYELKATISTVHYAQYALWHATLMVMDAITKPIRRPLCPKNGTLSLIHSAQL